MRGEYVLNEKTMQLEMRVNRVDYVMLEDKIKKKIQKNFLFFGRDGGKWISREKFPNIRPAVDTCKDLGLTDVGKIDERLSLVEEEQRKEEEKRDKAERERRRSEAEATRAEILQRPFKSMPVVEKRPFSKQRNKILHAWDRGFDEFCKSEYYAERAKVARETVEEISSEDKDFIKCQIKEAEKTIQEQRRNIKDYEKLLARIQSGKELKQNNGEILIASDVSGWIDNAELVLENAMSKVICCYERLDELGGVDTQFSKDNIKPGYYIRTSKWGECAVIFTRGNNVVCDTISLSEDNPVTATYDDIECIISDDPSTIPKHPFNKENTFTISVWNDESGMRERKTYIVKRVTDEKVMLKSGKERAFTKKPRRLIGSDGNPTWAIDINNNNFRGTIYKRGDRKK